MYNGVDYVRELCQQRKIAVSTLEKECGFSNGYLNPKKLKKIPYERAVKIAKYLNIAVDLLLPEVETEELPIQTDADNEDLSEYLEMLRNRSECRMLFSLAKGATKEDVEKAVAIIEALRKTEGR